jgi:hypothetical protein
MSTSLLEKVQFDTLEDAASMSPKGHSNKEIWEGQETALNGTFFIGVHKYVFTTRQDMPDRNGFLSVHIALCPELLDTNDHESRVQWIEKDRWFRDEVFLTMYRTGANKGFDTDIRAGYKYCKPCIVCGKKLVSEYTTVTRVYQQPSGGTAFKTNGHYGSGVFDPMTGAVQLTIIVCDECMIEAGKQSRVEHEHTIRTTVDESVISDWKIDGDYYSG